MSKKIVLTLIFIATFFQAGAYGLTFLFPPLFETFSADEKDVGAVLFAAAIATIVVIIFSGHLTSLIGRLQTLALSSLLITMSLFIFGQATSFGISLFIAGVLLGAGWGLFYALIPVIMSQLADGPNRVRYFSLQAAFMMAGFGLSPVFGYYLVEQGIGIHQAFIANSIACILSAVCFYVLIKPVEQLSNSIAKDNARLSLIAFARVAQSPAIIPIIMVCIGACVFSGMTNFQTVYAKTNALDYSHYFLSYTFTVIVLRIAFAGFGGGKYPYLVIALLLFVMTASVILFYYLGNNSLLYIIGASLFGIGYGVSYPIIAAMAANDADGDLVAQSMQILSLFYFVGIFGFPFIAGWMIITVGMKVLLVLVAVMAGAEAMVGLLRHLSRHRIEKMNSQVSPS